MARAGPRKVSRYGDQFKATAVKLSSLRGVMIKDVAEALDIHPFMLSLWRKEVRDGVIVAKGAKLDVQTKAELKRLKALERFERHIAAGSPFVDTSEWESTHALMTGSQVWVWTFRKSRNDREIPPRLIAFVHGFPKWGQPSNAGV